jgi:hypothetical protein
VFGDRVVIDDGQFYPNTLGFIKIRVHYYKDDLHAFKRLLDRLAMNLLHLQGNYEKYSKAEEIMVEKVPQTTLLRFPVDSFC